MEYSGRTIVAFFAIGLFLGFLAGGISGQSIGRTEGYKQYYLGQAECVTVSNKIVCVKGDS